MARFAGRGKQMTSITKVSCDAPECSRILFDSEVKHHPMLYIELPSYLTLSFHNSSDEHFCSFLCLAKYVKAQFVGGKQ